MEIDNQNSNKNSDDLAKKLHDIIIIGSGPAAYSCGLYAARANRHPILFEGTVADGLLPGGQLTITNDVENYLGFESINGFDLTQKFKEHAIKFGLQVIEKTVKKVNFKQPPFTLFDGDKEYRAKSVVIATGATARKLGIPKEEKFWHHGISACAVCDGALPLFRKKPLVVIGGGDTAMEEASFLTKFGSKVYVIHRRDSFRASKIMIDRVLQNPKIQVIWDTIVVDAEGEKSLEKLHLKNLKTGETSVLEANGLFYAIGHVPNTAFLDKQLTLDEDNYIITVPGSTKTNIPGVFACGDVQDKKYRQAITSAGTGCMSSLDAEHWLSHWEGDRPPSSHSHDTSKF
jgi:thioredoxin reductase (NADPH)